MKTRAVRSEVGPLIAVLALALNASAALSAEPPSPSDLSGNSAHVDGTAHKRCAPVRASGLLFP